MESLFSAELLDKIHGSGVIAVLVLDQADDAIPLAEALLAGGVDAMELTLRTPAAVGAISAITRKLPEMTVGAGTVLSTGQVKQVADAGAAFGVAPGLNGRIVKQAGDVGLPFAPGIATPSELEAAIELGCREVKFFPAEPCGGMGYLKSLAAPYAHLNIRYMPLGGLNPENAAGYMQSPLILAVGGSWIAPRDFIRQHDWRAITERAAGARQLVNDARKGAAK